MLEIKYDVAKEYYPRPMGRARKDGLHSGERFREEVLLPFFESLKDNPNQILILDFNGISTAGSSYLEESFGGLIRENGYRKSDLNKHIRIVVDDDLKELITDRIEKYINDAESKVK